MLNFRKPSIVYAGSGIILSTSLIRCLQPANLIDSLNNIVSHILNYIYHDNPHSEKQVQLCFERVASRSCKDEDQLLLSLVTWTQHEGEWFHGYPQPLCVLSDASELTSVHRDRAVLIFAGIAD